MPHPYSLDIQIKETDANISLQGTLGDAEWDLLEEFLFCVDEMARSRLVLDNMSSSLRLEGDESGVVRMAVKMPPWEDVQAFLHVLRPILLEKENTNFYKICNLISREFNHPYFRGLVVVQREMYNGKRLQEQFEIKSEGVLLNSEQVLQQWLNAYEFHRDKRKKSFIDSLHQLLPLEASEAIFLSLLTEKARAAINLGLIVRVILGKQEQVTGRSRRPPDR